MTKLTIFEGVSPAGHAIFNKEYLYMLSGYTSNIYIGSSISEQYKSFDIDIFNDSYVRGSRVIHSLGFLFRLITILLKMRKDQSNKLLILSYDLSSLFFATYIALFFGISLFTVEHNTVPKSRRVKFLQYLCSKSLSRICLTPKVKFIFQQMKQKSTYIDLPMVYIQKYANSIDLINKYGYEKYIFCPSASSDFEKINEQALKYPDILFIVKSKFKSITSNVKCFEYFDDYYNILAKSNAVFIPFLHENRVSGPMIESLSLNKKVILSEGDLYQFSKVKFGLNIFNSCTDDFHEILNFKIKKDISVEMINDDIKKKLLLLINE